MVRIHLPPGASLLRTDFRGPGPPPQRRFRPFGRLSTLVALTGESGGKGRRGPDAAGTRDRRAVVQNCVGKRYPPPATAIEERGDGIVSAGFGDGHAGFGISRGIAGQGDFARRPDDRLRCRQHRPRSRSACHRYLHVLRSSGQARHRDHDDPRRQGWDPVDHRLVRHVGLGCRARLDGQHRA